MKIRHDYGRYEYPRSVRHHTCRICGWQWIILQWDFLPNVRYGICAPCAADRWADETSRGGAMVH